MVVVFMAQKFHFGIVGVNIIRLGEGLQGEKKVDLGALLRRAGMQRPLCLNVIFSLSFKVFPRSYIAIRRHNCVISRHVT